MKIYMQKLIVAKRKSKEDLRKIFLSKLEESKLQYREGKVNNARFVFNELRVKYKY